MSSRKLCTFFKNTLACSFSSRFQSKSYVHRRNIVSNIRISESITADDALKGGVLIGKGVKEGRPVATRE